jgi:hypothetical protein
MNRIPSIGGRTNRRTRPLKVRPTVEDSMPAATATIYGDDERRFVPLLGAAALHLWAELPQEVQRSLFEHAVVIGHRLERDESLREQLAQFLHDRHMRSQQTAR